MHRNFSVYCLFLSLVFVILSCGGESDPAPAGTTNGPPSTAAVVSSSGDCSSTGLFGTFIQGIALDPANNSASVSVDVTEIGSYSISTNTVNGYSFSGTGTFKTKGVQNVTLTASGTPLASGTDTFVVTLQNSTCSFQVKASLNPATYASRIVISTGQPFSSSNFYTYAFDGNGKKIWSVPGYGSTVTIRADTVYMLLDGNPGAYNVKTGAQFWLTTNTQGMLSNTPAIGPNMMYSTSDNGKLVAIRTKDGSTAWSYAAGTTSVISSSPTYQNGVIYFGSPDKNIYGVNADGTLKWKYLTGGDVRSSPVISNNIVYCGSDDGKIYALNASNGSLLWSFNAGIDGQYSPTLSNGKVFIQGAQNIYCLDATTGSVVWSYDVPNPYDWSSPTEVNGILYVLGISDGLQTFNSTTGAMGWSNQSFGQTSQGSPTLFNGVAYVSAAGGLVAVDITSGTTLWSYGNFNPTSSTVTSFYTSPVVYDTETKTTGYPADSGNMQ